MEVFNFDGFTVPVKTWLPMTDIEASANIQIDNCARLPFMFKHDAILSAM